MKGILKQFGVPVFPIKEEKGADDDGPKAAAPAGSAPTDSARASKR